MSLAHLGSEFVPLLGHRLQGGGGLRVKGFDLLKVTLLGRIAAGAGLAQDLLAAPRKAADRISQ